MVTIRNLSKSYQGRKVIDGLDLTVPDDPPLCLMGPSGCGKTTLLRILAGLEKADGGTISGLPVRVSMAFQEDRLAEPFSAVHNIMLVTGRSVSRTEILSHLEELGLGECTDMPVRELSGGMRRRVTLARTMLAPSGLLLMDEILKGLDEAVRRRTAAYIRHHRDGRPLLFVTHDAEEAELIGGRIAVWPGAPAAFRA